MVFLFYTMLGTVIYKTFNVTSYLSTMTFNLLNNSFPSGVNCWSYSTTEHNIEPHSLK